MRETFQVPPELLIQVLFYLSSLEVVKTRQVSKHWLSAVDSTASLFRSLYLPSSNCSEDSKALEFFIQKSCCSLRHVHISKATIGYFSSLPDYHSKLCRCRSSLRRIEIGRIDYSQYKSLLEFAFSCPNLEKISLCYLTPLAIERVKVVEKMKKMDWREGDNDQNDPSLRSLKLSNFFSNLLEDNNLNFMSSVTSLNLESIKESDLKILLEGLSSTLRHLKMVGFSTGQQVKPVILPLVQVIEINPSRSFPGWLKVPNCQTLVLGDVDVDTDLDSLPSSIEEVWLTTSHPSRCEKLDLEKLMSGRFFRLKTLRLDVDVEVEPDQLMRVLRSRSSEEISNEVKRNQRIEQIILDSSKLEIEMLKVFKGLGVEVLDTAALPFTLKIDS